MVNFKTENKLVINILNNIEVFMSKSKNVFVSKELEVGGGRADIVISYIDNDLFNERIKISDTLGNMDSQKIAIMSILYNNMPIKLSTISSKVNINEHELKEILDELNSKGFVSKINNKYIRNISCYIRKNIVVEAKLSHWKQALNQAYRNQLYAKESYVVLDKNQARGAYENIDKFKKSNIGFAVASNSSGNLEIIWKPQPQKPYSKFFTWLANEKLYEKWIDERLIFK